MLILLQDLCQLLQMKSNSFPPSAAGPWEREKGKGEDQSELSELVYLLAAQGAAQAGGAWWVGQGPEGLTPGICSSKAVNAMNCSK